MVAHMRAPDDFDMIVAEAPAQEASSPASALSTPSVEFTETNPEALRGLGLGIDAIDQKAPGDTVMNDTESESEVGEISAGAALSVPMQQVCLFFFIFKTISDNLSEMVLT